MDIFPFPLELMVISTCCPKKEFISATEYIKIWKNELEALDPPPDGDLYQKAVVLHFVKPESIVYDVRLFTLRHKQLLQMISVY